MAPSIDLVLSLKSLKVKAVPRESWISVVRKVRFLSHMGGEHHASFCIKCLETSAVFAGSNSSGILTHQHSFHPVRHSVLITPCDFSSYQRWLCRDSTDAKVWCSEFYCVYLYTQVWKRVGPFHDFETNMELIKNGF